MRNTSGDTRSARRRASRLSAPTDANPSFVFTALQEQLGLKVKSTKGPINVLVIDHVEKPAED
jgi:uncharacterized protein (TIGR03435 family)